MTPGEPEAAITALSPLRAVLGTAGHVDHGKTTLVQHLTGIDTDRLSEEKARGISIELGFAWLDRAEGRVAIIDVPGHERFVRQMIAGAAGMDVVLLVIAADEGVMPQTCEHLDICELLGVRVGGVVITKVDLVDDEWLELVRDDVASAVAGTFLEGAPIVAYAAGDDARRADVVALIDQLVAASDLAAAGRSVDRPFKLSVDRVFTMRGFGTVVTGTTSCGELAVGDAVTLLPDGRQARVRGLQMHGVAAERVGPGVRAAVNLIGVDHHGVHRGDVVAKPGELSPTSMVDVTFRALPRLGEPVADRTKVLVHIGTAQVEATLALVGADVVSPGAQVAAQLRLARPIAILPGEPYVARGFAVLEGYGKTIGGGRALTPQTRRHRRSDGAAQATIEALASADVDRGVAAYLLAAGDHGAARAALWCHLPYEAADIDTACASRLASGELIEAGGVIAARAAFEPVLVKVGALLADFHVAHPARRGLREGELRTRIRPDLDGDLFAALVNAELAAGRLGQTGDDLHLPAHQARRSATQDRAVTTILEALQAGGLMPPRIADLPEATGLDVTAVEEALVFLVDDGDVIRVSRELAFSRAALDALEGRLRAHFAAHDTLDTPTFKQMTGASRKWTIPLGEYFDRARVTVRVGDLRRLRGGQA